MPIVDYPNHSGRIDAECSEILQSLVDAVTQSERFEQLVQSLLRLLAKISEFENTFLTVIDHGEQSQKVLYSFATGDFGLPVGTSSPWEETLCKRCLEERLQTAVDVPTHWPDATLALSLGIRSYVSVPILVEPQGLTGTLCAIDRQASSLQAPQYALLEMMAKLIGRQWEHDLLMRRLEAENLSLRGDAHEDSLTGVANRRALLADLGRTLANAARKNNRVQLAFIDLDHFKEINDQHGHQVGDAFLRQVAHRLRTSLRQGDFLGRYGGDEFVVYGWAPEATDDDLSSWQQRIENCVEGIYNIGPVNIAYRGASVGVVLSQPDETAEDLLNRADHLMYYRKILRRSK